MIMCIGISCCMCFEGVGLVLDGGSEFFHVFPQFVFLCLLMLVQLVSFIVHEV